MSSKNKPKHRNTLGITRNCVNDKDLPNMVAAWIVISVKSLIVVVFYGFIGTGNGIGVMLVVVILIIILIVVFVMFVVKLSVVLIVLLVVFIILLTTIVSLTFELSWIVEFDY